MIRGLMGKKIGMTQIFDAEGNLIPVTVVEAGPCTILGLKENPNKVKASRILSLISKVKLTPTKVSKLADKK